MELTALDRNFKEQFLLKHCNADFAVGEENTFSVTVHLYEFEKMKNIEYFSVLQSEFGGRITDYSIDTDSKTAAFTGRCWRGMLEDKIICPAAGSDYYKVQGSPCAIMEKVIADAGLSEIFRVEPFTVSGISSYQFARYCTVLDGFNAMLKSIEYVLIIGFDGVHVILSAEKVKNYELDNYDCKFNIQKGLLPYNHLICLGKGELKDRQVIHLYLDKNGKIGKSQQYYGIDERTAVYDYPNVEDLQTLEEQGIEHFKDLLSEEGIETAVNNADIDIGHGITTYEHYTNTVVTKRISKRILTIQNSSATINYEVNDYD